MSSATPSMRQKLTDLAMQFNVAAMRKQTDPVFEARLLDSMSYTDIQEVDRLTRQISDLEERLEGAVTESRFYSNRVFTLANALSKIYTKICDREELQSCIPPEAHQPEIIEAFENNGVSDFARLCRATI